MKRRNVPKGIISYVIFSWVVLQVISVLSSLISMPEWAGKTALISLLIIFPIWTVFIWFYDITSEGIKKTAQFESEIDEDHTTAIGKKLNVFIVAALSVAVVLLFIDRFRIQKHNSEGLSEIQHLSETEKSIVVLPFQDLSPEKNYEYFADGLAEELLNSLTRVSALKVTSRTSAFSFKNTNTDIPTIAKQLGVNYILEGSVRTSDSLIRISIQLIDTKDDKSIWSQSWDRKLKNIFEIQNSIARSVTSNMEIALTEDEFPEVLQTDPEAYALYLEAKFWQHKNIDLDKNLNKAKALINKSLAIDSSYVPSWVLLSNILRLQALHGFIDSELGFAEARKAADKALELDPKNALGFRALANIALEWQWDFKTAQDYINKALSLDPQNAMIIDAASGFALVNGDIDKAIRLNEQAVKLDPVNVDCLYNLSVGYYYNEQYDEAMVPMRKSLELDPEQAGAHYMLSLMYVGKKEYVQALEEIKREPYNFFQIHARSLIYWAQGDKTASEKELSVLINHPDNWDLGVQIAQTYAYRGDNDNAFKWLDRAIEAHAGDLVDAQVDPILQLLHTDPRWSVFLKKMKFSQ